MAGTVAFIYGVVAYAVFLHFSQTASLTFLPAAAGAGIVAAGL